MAATTAKALEVMLKKGRMEPTYVTVAFVCERLNLQREAVIDLLNQGAFPHLRIRRRTRITYRIPRKDFLEWERSNTFTGRPAGECAGEDADDD